jgi:acyl transferase domain-containing protein/acyl carrier protein
MTDQQAFLERIAQLSPKRLALLALDLQSKLAARTEPLAIVGMGCRFPGGANDPDAYWRLLRDGVDAIGAVPADRWDSDALFDPNPDAPGKVATRWGGFLEGIDQFDPRFFGISPREASSMDPQQRLLLEVGWEALENSGYAPDQLAETPTGVFVGICNGDYYQMLMDSPTTDVDAYAATGSAHSVASGRLSYLLGLRGPSLSVDTACSSSLVAVHLAAQSLRAGECRMALAGGVNAILSPRTTIALSRARMMAADGRCKAFDAAADGFVRSEGAGFVVLKRVSDARADGDRILALLRGSATNQDGRSNGLTAPNGPSQVAVIRQALADAGVKPADVGYVETHGTGTSLGDPIEAQALGAALGVDRPADRPLIIGSAKTNLGHLESAAGIAGLIKTVLSLQRAQIPRLLHFQQPSRQIPWASLPLEVPTRLMAWPDRSRPRIAGVSSFGFSGTNAHVVLEEAPRVNETASEAAAPTRHLVTLSAASERSLVDLARDYAHHLAEQPETPLADVAYTTHVGRAQLGHRLSVVASDTAAASTALTGWLAGDDIAGIATGTLDATSRPGVAFLFPGQGAQYPGMGRLLYETQPAFRAALDECAAVLEPLLDRPLFAVIWPASHGRQCDADLLDRTLYTQPATFAIEYALARMWLGWGVQPKVVLGHSAGEYAAACIAGVFSVQDALKLVVARARLMDALPRNGAMASVRASEARVARAIGHRDASVSIAALNGPESTVIAGVRPQVEDVLSELEHDGVETRRLAISIAAHSPLMDPLLEAFERVASEVTYSPPRLDVISSVTGSRASGGDLMTAAYWRRHIRETVRFAEGIRTIQGFGCDVMLEVGPTPTLLSMADRCLPGARLTLLPSLRREADDWQQLLDSVARLWVSGVRIDWAAMHTQQSQSNRRVALPTSRFERTRCWAPRPHGPRARPARTESGHPLLGERLRSPAVADGTVVYETVVNAHWPSFIQDHRIHGMLVLPSPVYVELALAAAHERWGAGSHALEDFAVDQALVIPEKGERIVQLVLTSKAPDALAFKIFSRPAEESADVAAWSLHASGRLRNAVSLQLPESPKGAELDVIRDRCAVELDAPAYYGHLHELGLQFGSSFRGATRIWRCDDEALGRIELPPELADDHATFHVHPALLDACFHVLGAPLTGADDRSTFLLVGIDKLRLYAPVPSEVWDHVVLRDPRVHDGHAFSASITLYDSSGALIADIQGIHLKRANRAALLSVTRRPMPDWLYEVEWEHASTSKPRTSLLTPVTLASTIEPTLASTATSQDLGVYGDVLPELEAFCGASIIRAFEELGWRPRPGEVVDVEWLARELRLVDGHRRLLRRLFEILCELGVLAADGAAWRVQQPLTVDSDLDAWSAGLLEKYPRASAEIELTTRCARGLADVLRGRVDPLDLLFPGGSVQLTERIYADSPFAQVHNAAIAQAVAALARDAGDRPLRILELGAGTGATTRAVLEALEERNLDCAFTFTDVSGLFVARAREQFEHDVRVTCRVLDLEVDPTTQDFSEHAYDVVLAANVLHATADLRQSLAHARRLLAPGGVLMLLEGTTQQRWVDLTFGLTHGWWRFADADLRTASALLPTDGWLRLLRASGFEQPVTVSAAGGQQAILMARQPETLSEQGPVEWLILADRAGTGAALARVLMGRGEACTVVQRECVSRPGELSDLLQDILGATETRRRKVLYLWPLDAIAELTSAPDTLEACVNETCQGALEVVRSLTSRASQSQVFFVTRGAQRVDAGDAPPVVAQSPMWGLGRVVALEHPELWGGLLDLSVGGTLSDDAAALATELGGADADDEDQVALRSAGRLVPRLVRPIQTRVAAARIATSGTHLITGGLGGLGLEVARWLANQGARHVTLLGRHAPSADRQVQVIRDIEELGCQVVVVTADVADETAMLALFDRFGADLPQLRGVIHAAAALGEAALTELSAEHLETTLRPKVRGAWLLHELTRALPLDYFVLFSSTTALWGSAGLGHYAAANTFLDALAQLRHALGLPALSINWGTWERMRVATESERERIAKFGLEPMPTQQALDALGSLMGDPPRPQVAVAAVDWTVLKAVYESRRRRPLLAGVGQPASPPMTAWSQPPRPSAAAPELRQLLDGAPSAERDGVVLHYVHRQVARVLGVDAERALDPAQGLFSMGLDSLMSVELKGRLETGVGEPLSSTLTFNYPTIGELARYLIEEVLPAAAEPSKAQPTGHEPEDRAGIGPDDAAITDAHDDLSEDDLANLLAAKLARLR